MPKKNLSLYQANAVNELAFEIDGYIQLAHPFEYKKYFENELTHDKGKYALKNDLFDILKCIFLQSDEETATKMVRLVNYIYNERDVMMEAVNRKLTTKNIRLLARAEANVILLEDLSKHASQAKQENKGK